jgi:hypothetical protein
MKCKARIIRWDSSQHGKLEGLHHTWQVRMMSNSICSPIFDCTLDSISRCSEWS